MNFWKEGIDRDECGEWEEVQDGTLINNQFGDFCIAWGPRSTNQAQRLALRHVIMECGFLGERTFENFYVGYAGLNGFGYPVCPVVEGRGEQWYGMVKPAKKVERHQKILVLGQVAHDASLMPFSHTEKARPEAYKGWLSKVIERFHMQGKQVAFKPHPSDPIHSTHFLRDDPRLAFRFNSLADAFRWADLAVAFSSNSLVEAFMAGVDVMPLHPTSLTWDVRSDLDNPREVSHDERLRWVDKVATYQWSAEQIASGECWRAMVQHA